MNTTTTKWLGGIVAILALALVGVGGALANDGTWDTASGNVGEANAWAWNDSTHWVGGVIAGDDGTTTSTGTATFPHNGWNWTEVDDGRNVKYIEHNAPATHSHAMTGGWLHLTDGGAIRSQGIRILYHSDIQLEGGSGGVYRFLEGTGQMQVEGVVRGTAASGGDYVLTLGGNNTGSQFTANSSLQNGLNGGTLSVIIDAAGSGAWSFHGNNHTYTGTTTVRRGQLNIRHDNALDSSTGPIQLSDALSPVDANITLRIETSGTTNYDIQVNNFNPDGTTTLIHPVWNRTWSGNIALNRDIEWASNNHVLTHTGVVSGVGAFTKTGVGTIRLSSANTHQGDTIMSAGTLELNNVNALQNSTLDTGTGGSVAFTLGGTQTYNLGGLKGTQDLAIGGNTISVGVNDQDTEYSGILGSTGGGLIKVGDGILTLAGDNTYTGGTTVNSGTLLINGDQSAATGAVMVNGGTLGGTGTIGGAVTVDTGGALSPGTSIGELTLADGLVSNGTILIDLAGSNPGEFDLISVTNGNAELGGLLDIALLNDFEPAFGSVFEVLNVTGGGSLIDNGIQLTGDYASVFAMSLDSGTGVLTLTSLIPEPTSALLLALGGLALLKRTRKP